MRFARVTLAADDTPATLKALLALTAKFDFIAFITIFAEPGNEDDATNGPARIGGSDVDRVAAGGVKGIQLLPGILYPDLFPPINGGGVYSFEQIYLTGKTGDVFQIFYKVV